MHDGVLSPVECRAACCWCASMPRTVACSTTVSLYSWAATVLVAAYRTSHGACISLLCEGLRRPRIALRRFASGSDGVSMAVYIIQILCVETLATLPRSSRGPDTTPVPTPAVDCSQGPAAVRGIGVKARRSPVQASGWSRCTPSRTRRSGPAAFAAASPSADCREKLHHHRGSWLPSSRSGPRIADLATPRNASCSTAVGSTCLRGARCSGLRPARIARSDAYHRPPGRRTS